MSRSTTAISRAASFPAHRLSAVCGGLSQGRWRWLPKPEAAHSEMCSACHRIHDRYPAGYVKLEGQFLAQHRDELMSIVRDVEQREKPEHPPQRT